MDAIKQEIITIGRAMLSLGYQNTHSGNISVRAGDQMYITKTGSMKGHLEERDICLPGLFEPQYGLFQSSSETGEHRAVLQYAGAMIHAHCFPVVNLSYMANEVRLLTAWGRQFLHSVPVVAFEFPVGSREMEEQIPQILERHPAMIVKTHGPFVRGADLAEAFFHLCLVDFSSDVDLQLRLLHADPPELPEGVFPTLPAYRRPRGVHETGDIVLIGQFRRTAHDLFHMKLSPFHTASLSVQDGGEMLYSDALSVPDELPFDIHRFSLAADDDDFFRTLHRTVYRRSNAKAALFTLSPEAAALGLRALGRGEDRIIPVDAEGAYFYPAVPVLGPQASAEAIVEKAVRYKMVVIAGLGVLAIGHTPGHTIHHNSSIKSLCHFRSQLETAVRLGQVAAVEPYLCQKGKNW